MSRLDRLHRLVAAGDQLAARDQLEHARRDLAAFARSPLARWRPWAHADRCPQGTFLRAAATTRQRVYRAGNRTGKTTVGAVDLALQWAGWHPFAPPRSAPRLFWASGLDWEFGVGQLLWPALRAVLPWSQVRSVVWYRQREPSIPHRIVGRDGSEIVFKSAEAGRRKYQGARLDGLWLDEEHPGDVVEEGRARLIDRGGQLWVTATPILNARWLANLEREPTTVVVRASMLDAAHAGLLDVDQAEAFAAALPERQRAVRIDGRAVALEGRVYPAYAPETHHAMVHGTQVTLGGTAVAPWPLPEGWLRYAAMDFGTSVPAAVPVLAEDPRTGRVFVETCPYAAWVPMSDWAVVLRERGLVPRSRGGVLAAPLVCDHDAAERLELRKGGVPSQPAAKGADSVKPGVLLVERWLTERLQDGHPRLVLVHNPADVHPLVGRCDGVGRDREGPAWELEGYHYPPPAREGSPDRPDAPVKRDDHFCDALRYVVTWLASGRRTRGDGLPTLATALPARYDPGVTPRAAW